MNGAARCCIHDGVERPMPFPGDNNYGLRTKKQTITPLSRVRSIQPHTEQKHAKSSIYHLDGGGLAGVRRCTDRLRCGVRLTLVAANRLRSRSRLVQDRDRRRLTLAVMQIVAHDTTARSEKGVV